jgi:glycosyltransferase involved in cell wall biosynthesis
MHTDVKGHPWLIARRPHCDSRVSVHAIRSGWRRRAALPALSSKSLKLGLEQNFYVLGRRADIPEILACCDIAVLPSRAEGLPNAVLEYMAAGLPTIVSRVGGNAELVQDGVTGCLCLRRIHGALRRAAETLA